MNLGTIVFFFALPLIAVDGYRNLRPDPAYIDCAVECEEGYDLGGGVASPGSGPPGSTTTTTPTTLFLAM